MKVLTSTESSAAAWKTLVWKCPFNDGSLLVGNTLENLSVSLGKFEIHVINYHPKALFLL